MVTEANTKSDPPSGFSFSKVSDLTSEDSVLARTSTVKASPECGSLANKKTKPEAIYVEMDQVPKKHSSLGDSGSSKKEHSTERSNLLDDLENVGSLAGKTFGDVMSDEGCTCIKCSFDTKISCFWCFASVTVIVLGLIVSFGLFLHFRTDVWNPVAFTVCNGSTPLLIEYSTSREMMLPHTCEVSALQGSEGKLLTGCSQGSISSYVVCFDYSMYIGANRVRVFGKLLFHGGSRSVHSEIRLLAVDLTNSTVVHREKVGCFEEFRVSRGGNFDNWAMFGRNSNLTTLAGYQCD